MANICYNHSSHITILSFLQIFICLYKYCFIFNYIQGSRQKILSQDKKIHHGFVFYHQESMIFIIFFVLLAYPTEYITYTLSENSNNFKEFVVLNMNSPFTYLLFFLYKNDIHAKEKKHQPKDRTVAKILTPALKHNH